jgi:hypothetical protein
MGARVDWVAAFELEPKVDRAGGTRVSTGCGVSSSLSALPSSV